jgi:hypothetical protein
MLQAKPLIIAPTLAHFVWLTAPRGGRPPVARRSRFHGSAWMDRVRAVPWSNFFASRGRGTGFAGPQAQRPPRGAGRYTK